MKICISARTFPPHVGSLENVAELTAQALGELGQEVTVVTPEQGPTMPARAYRLIRQPGVVDELRVYRNADVVLTMNVSLFSAPMIWLAGTPLVVWHHGLTHSARPHDSPRGLRAWLKRLIVEHAVKLNAACSEWVGARLPSTRPIVVATSCFDRARFHNAEATAKQDDIAFVGRLVSQKGVHLLLEALWSEPRLGGARLTIIGEGPERKRLEALTSDRGLSERVRYTGALGGNALVAELARHRIVAVPSVGYEAFGIVALEGIAANCVVIASDSGGLPEAVGECGIIFPKGDVVALAEALIRAREQYDELSARIAKFRESHLNRFTPNATAVTLQRALGGVASGHSR